MHTYHYRIPISLGKQRIDKAVAELGKDLFSRSQIQGIIKDGKLLLNNQVITNPAIKVLENDQVSVNIQEISGDTDNLSAINIPLNIVFEDQDIIILDKTAGMTVHPGAGTSNTLVNALLYHTQDLSDIGGQMRPGIVHRLDRDTSGLMVVAKNNHAHAILASQIANRTLIRKYKAVIWGIMHPLEGDISLAIARSTGDRKKMTTLKKGGRAAVTHYKTIEILGNRFSIVECKLDTGRTHQIRVHLSHSGHSIVGDQTYGNNQKKIHAQTSSIQRILMPFQRQALHSFYMRLNHPVHGGSLEFTSAIPADISNIIDSLRNTQSTL